MKRRTVLAALGMLPWLANARELDELENIARQNRARHAALLAQLARAQPAEIYRNPADPYLGPAQSTQTVVYFTDFNCPYCRRLEPVIASVARAHPNVRFVFKLLPLMDASSRPAALLALARWQQAPADYWALHQALMRGPLPLGAPFVQQARHRLPPPLPAQIQAAETALKANLALADRLKVFSTPVMLIGTQLHAGYTDAATLKRTLAQAGFTS